MLDHARLDFVGHGVRSFLARNVVRVAGGNEALAAWPTIAATDVAAGPADGGPSTARESVSPLSATHVTRTQLVFELHSRHQLALPQLLREIAYDQ